jgi:hypothetical protein
VLIPLSKASPEAGLFPSFKSPVSVMAITSLEAVVPAHSFSSLTPHEAVELSGRTQMRKVKVFAVSAAMFAIGFGKWTASTTNAVPLP